MRNQKMALLVSSLLLVCLGHTRGQSIIASRTDLNGLLGSQRADEGFELYGEPDNGGSAIGGYLSATNGYPVVNGMTIVTTNPDANAPDSWIQWNGNGLLGSTTKTIGTSYGLRLDFWSPTLAFGLDVKDYPDSRTVFTYGITVFAADDTTILYSNDSFDMSDPANGVFFGYQNPNGGIGSVILETISGIDSGEVGFLSSPFIDNLAFSTAPIPEPSVMAFGLLGLGALTLRFRKI